jgi:hypothetical protein
MYLMQALIFWLKHSLAMDTEPVPSLWHRRGVGLDSDPHSRQVARSSGLLEIVKKMRPSAHGDGLKPKISSRFGGGTP